MCRQRSFPRRGQGRARRMARGQQEAGGSLMGGHRSRGPALDPEGPPEGSLPLRSSGRMARPGHGASAVRRPRGLLLLAAGRRHQGTPHGQRWHREAQSAPPLPPAGSVSCWPARAPCTTGARWDLFVAAAGLGEPAGCRDPSVCQGLHLLSAAPCCCVTGCPPVAATARGRGGAVRRELGGPLSQHHSTSWTG